MLFRGSALAPLTLGVGIAGGAALALVDVSGGLFDIEIQSACWKIGWTRPFYDIYWDSRCFESILDGGIKYSLSGKVLYFQVAPFAL